ncbi:hypothetical protein [Streptomyces sp. NPDC058155]|uniref:hypothetical protein n=1 Tax=Streptomyces sp. NPDC058155 TaxID=3346359 RepID=UPI0036E967F6
MSNILLPSTFDRVTKMTIVVPVGAVSDLPAPGREPTVIPARIEMWLTREEGTPRGIRESAYVSVVGPRRLKSGAPGKEISTGGWESARNEHWRGGHVDRPEWLTELIAANWPEGWPDSLVELSGGAA